MVNPGNCEKRKHLLHIVVRPLPPPYPTAIAAYMNAALREQAVLALDLAIKGDAVFARATDGAIESRFFLNRQEKNISAQ